MLGGIEGRTTEPKRGLVQGITAAALKHFGAAPEAVTIRIVEAAKTDKARIDKAKGGKARSGKTKRGILLADRG